MIKASGHSHYKRTQSKYTFIMTLSQLITALLLLVLYTCFFTSSIHLVYTLWTESCQYITVFCLINPFNGITHKLYSNIQNTSCIKSLPLLAPQHHVHQFVNYLFLLTPRRNTSKMTPCILSV